MTPPPDDAEKHAPVLAPGVSPEPSVDGDEAGHSSKSLFVRYFKTFERTLVRYNLEARGIQRVLPEHRHTTQHLGFTQICLLWISINLCAINITLGMLGPAVFSLSFLDSSLCAVFGMLVRI